MLFKMDKLIIGGKEIYYNLDTSTEAGGTGEEGITKKVENIEEYKCINENGDYACKSTVILEGLILSILNKLKLKHVPKFLSLTRHNGHVYLKTEEINGSSLDDIHHTLTDDEKDIITFQILYALHEFEGYEFMHANLESKNIIIEKVEPSMLEYNINGEIYNIHNQGMNVRLVDFSKSRITAYGTYIFNENDRQRDYPDDYDVRYNPMIDIFSIIENHDLSVDRIKSKRHLIVEGKTNIYNVIATLFDLPRKEIKIKKKTINEDRSLLTEARLFLGKDELSDLESSIIIPFVIASYPSIKQVKYFNKARTFRFLMTNKMNRLLYKFLTYHDDYVINEIHFDTEYTTNRKILNKMRQVSQRNIKYDDTKTVTKIYEPIVLEHRVELFSDVYDPIMLEYVDEEQWLLDSNNVIFIIDGQKIASKREYFKQVPNINLLLQVAKIDNTVDYIKTLKSRVYINLNSYGIPIVVDREIFNRYLEDNQTITFNTSNDESDFINYEYAVNNPESYLYKTEFYGHGRDEYVSLRNYTHKWDRAINCYLRSKKTDEEYLKDEEFLKYYLEYGNYPEEALETIKDAIKNIDQSFLNSRVSTYEFLVYRGSKGKEIYSGINLGFTSTSKQYETAEAFSGEDGIIYEIHVGVGVPYIYMEPLTLAKKEEEILFPRGLITEIQSNEGNVYTVKLILENEEQFKNVKDYQSFKVSAISTTVDADVQEPISIYLNAIKDGQLIDELDGDIIDFNTCIINDDICYNIESLTKYFIDTFNPFKVFLDPFKRTRFSDENINLLFKRAKGINKLSQLQYLLKYTDFSNVMELVDENKDLINDYISLITYHDVRLVKYIFSKGYDINSWDGRVFLDASKNGNLEVVKYFVENGVDIHIKDDRAILDAYLHDNFEIVKYLIQNGANVQVQNNTILINASSDDNLWLIEMLVEHGADVNAKNSEALMNAVDVGNFEIAKYLIEHGASINDAVLEHVSPRNLELVKYLVEYGIDIHANQDELLMRACSYGNLELVKYLVENGAGVNAQNGKALVVTSHSNSYFPHLKNYFKIVKYLVENGADVNVNNGKALSIASLSGNFEVVKYLVDNDADVSANNNQALIFASYNGNLEIVKYLIEHGADVHAQKDLALAKAKNTYRQDVIEYLMEKMKE